MKAVQNDFPSATPSRANSLSMNDEVNSRHGTPPVPPGFEQQLAESRRATPTIPPGLSKPTALPNLDDGPISRPGSRASLRRQASTQLIMPALPLRPGTPVARTATPSRFEDREGKSTADVETPTKSSKGVSGKGRKTLALVEQTDETPKPVDSEPAKPEKTASLTTVAATSPVKPMSTSVQSQFQDESTTESQARTEQPSVLNSQPAQKGRPVVQPTSVDATPATPEKPRKAQNDASKRKHPGKLDITAAVTNRDRIVTLDSTPVEMNSPAKSTEAATPVKSTVSGTPGRPSLSRVVSQTASIVSKPDSPEPTSTAIKVAPRTLRVVQTPKTETPLTQTFGAPPAAIRLPSRKPSVASINPPGTPSSEHVSMSDNISLTSTSMSRANSPPLSKVGSAPVRTKTKSQLKKERLERAKAIVQVEEEEAKAATAEEPAQEAIIGRKKKEKKAKDTKAKIKPAASIKEAAPSTSSAGSPVPPAETVNVEVQAATEPSEPRVATPVKSQEVKSPSPPFMPSPHEPSPPPTPTLTAASLMAELKAHAPELQQCIDSLFRAPNHSHFKPSQPISAKDLTNPHVWKHDFKLNLTKDEIDALMKGTLPAIHYGGQEGRMWDRGMVTGSGAHIRALTADLEQRFLELEKVLREVPEELRFRPSKPQNETKFPSIDLEAMRRQFDAASARGVSVMEQMVQDGSTIKKGAFLVDEASKYVNEFVMPPTPPTPTAQLQNHHMPVQAPSGPGPQGYAGGKPQPAPSQPLSNNLPSAVPAEQVTLHVEIADRQLADARRAADEKDSALRKVMKKNRRLLGLV